MTTKLPAQVQKTTGIGNGMRTATIAAVSSSGVTINVSGGLISSGVGVLTSYAPRVGDTVAVFRQDSSWLILGPTSAVNPWVAFSSLPGGYQNNWSDRSPGSFPIGQYRIEAAAVRLIGELNTTSIPGSGQTIVAGLPAPTGEAVMLGTMSTVECRLVVNSSGTLQIYDAVGAGLLQFSCSYPLDARLR